MNFGLDFKMKIIDYRGLLFGGLLVYIACIGYLYDDIAEYALSNLSSIISES